jgi:hypothetical protein
MTDKVAQLLKLADRIERTSPTELDRSVPRNPQLITVIRVSNEEQFDIVEGLRLLAATKGQSHEGYDHSYGD